MPKVLKAFTDKYSKKKYRRGNEFDSSSEDRLEFLAKEGYIEKAPKPAKKGKK